VAADLVGPENLNAATAAWALQMALAYLDHLSNRGEVEELNDSDPRLWRLATGG
jgi:hypothetical protein